MSRTTWAAAVLTAGLLAGSTGTAFAAADSPTAGSTAGSAAGSGSGSADGSTAGSAGGSTGGSAAGGDAAGLRADAAQDCKLIADLGPVVSDLLGVVNGRATTPGSSAWLSAQAARAKAAGRANLAAWLTERATLRQEQGAVLGTRQQLLADGASWCQAHGFGVAS